MIQTEITIVGETIAPGKRCELEIPVARLITHTLLSLPVTVLHGMEPGPCLWLSAAIHGDEINGVEIIRQVLEQVNPQKMRGTLIAVPIVNVFGFLEQSRYLPDRRDLNRSFPGSAEGSLASRLAHLFMREIVSRCTHGIDILYLQVQLGKSVRKKQVLGIIANAFGKESVAVRAPWNGLVIGHTQNPLVNQGDGIIHLLFGSSEQ